MSHLKLLLISPPDEQVLGLLEPLRAQCDIRVGHEQRQLERWAPDAEVLVLAGGAAKSIDLPRLWQHATGVRWVHSLAAGVESLLFPALVDSSVPLTNARGVYKRSLAEFALLGILYHYKRVGRLLQQQRQRQWAQFTVQSLQDRIMGIVGFGETGRECALLARALGMRIHALRRHPQHSAGDPLVERSFGPDQLAQMLPGIDVLLCAAPLTATTRHMIGHAQLALLKPTALFVNVGRGPVVEEAALVAALQDQRLAGAALDVFEHEPLPAASPLWDLENVLLSPHCTDWTERPSALELTMRCFIENLHRYQRGEPLENLVDKRAGY
jgi:phosphoglycerate dehydrogenase-like enzyme